MVIFKGQKVKICALFGPLDLLPWHVVGRSVGRSVCPSVNICNSATYVRIFFKIGVNIPWVNITRRFFNFCKIFNFEFKKKIIAILKNLKVHFLKICQITFFYFSIQLPWDELHELEKRFNVIQSL